MTSQILFSHFEKDIKKLIEEISLYKNESEATCYSERKKGKSEFTVTVCDNSPAQGDNSNVRKV